MNEAIKHSQTQNNNKNFTCFLNTRPCERGREDEDDDGQRVNAVSYFSMGDVNDCH